MMTENTLNSLEVGLGEKVLIENCMPNYGVALQVEVFRVSCSIQPT